MVAFKLSLHKAHHCGVDGPARLELADLGAVEAADDEPLESAGGFLLKDAVQVADRK
jgi:hypothetical protein